MSAWSTASFPGTPVRAHLLLEYHKRLDQASEARRGSGKIGTTGRGIGPAYEDKIARHGVRVGDLLNTGRARERMIAAARKSQLWRDGKIEWLPDTDWAAVDTSPLSMQIHTFACDPKNRDANGMLRVTSDEPMATTWAYFWTDGVEPKWTSTRSAEEINAEIDAKLAEAREVLAQGAALAGASLNRIESEREETINNQQKLFAQLKQKASPVLHSWMGLPERALVASWGVPQQSYESGGSRFLYYAYGYTTELVDQYGNEIPQESWACHMTFEVRDGLIADYRSHGNYCQTAAANLPYGRPRE